MSPLTVACISVSSALGGSEWSLLDFARRAKEHGIDVAVVLPKDGPLGNELGRAGVRAGVATAPAALLALSQREMLSLGGVFTLTAGLAAWSRAIAKANAQVWGAAPAVLYS